MTVTKVRKAFGQRVRGFRLAKGYSQEKFADIVGLHRTYIGAVERGEQNVSIDNIAKIAKSLKVSLEDMFKNL